MFKVGNIARSNIKSYIFVEISNGPLRKRYKAQLDSGNTLKSGVAISSRVLREMRQTTSGPARSVSTAQQGAVMRCHGVSKPLQMRIEGLNHQFLIQPTVIENLAGTVNIGTAFFTQISKGGQVSLTYQDGRPSLVIQGVQTEMIQNVSEIPVHTDNRCLPPPPQWRTQL